MATVVQYCFPTSTPLVSERTRRGWLCTLSARTRPFQTHPVHSLPVGLGSTRTSLAELTNPSTSSGRANFARQNYSKERVGGSAGTTQPLPPFCCEAPGLPTSGHPPPASLFIILFPHNLSRGRLGLLNCRFFNFCEYLFFHFWIFLEEES